MKRSRLIGVVILIAAAVLLVGVLVYSLVYKKILADSIYGNEIDRISRQFDVDNDGLNENITILIYQKDSKNQFYLEVNHTKKSTVRLQLSGFENEANFCPEAFPQFNQPGRLICVFGPVGAHSENIELISYQLQTNQLTPTIFNLDQSKSDNIASDAPLFGFENNNRLEFYVENRNYDADPTLDSLRSYYYFKDDEFLFDKTVPLVGGELNSNQEGKIN